MPSPIPIRVWHRLVGVPCQTDKTRAKKNLSFSQQTSLHRAGRGDSCSSRQIASLLQRVKRNASGEHHKLRDLLKHSEISHPTDREK